MKSNIKELTWPEVGLFTMGAAAGALLGVWALSRLAAAMVAQAPGFWFVSRAGGIVAYLLLWASTAWGVMFSAKGLTGRMSKQVVYAVHNITSWLALGFAAVHAVALLGDRVVPFSGAGVLVPFAASYRPFLTGLGTLSLYLGIAVSASFYWKKLSHRTWHAIHMLSYLMFVAVTIHGLMLGTDSSAWIMRTIYLLATGSVAFLTTYRILTAGTSRKPAERRQVMSG
jgi:methionine sulfoxide reductase heme-binding subunit